eukprot:gene8844-6369_t
MGSGGSTLATTKYVEKHKHLKEGDRVPDVPLKFRVIDPTTPSPDPRQHNFVWKDIMISDMLAGKRVVIFGVPGAFTPVCSCDHLPGYENNYDSILRHGIDDVFCFSVNDAFVMRHWGIAQGLEEELTSCALPINPGNFKRVKLVPDGAAKFSRAMGMTCHWDKKGGFGLRSWRYSAVVKDMVIEKIFVEVEGNIEDDSPAGPEPLMVSDANTMLNYLSEVSLKATITDTVILKQ